MAAGVFKEGPDLAAGGVPGVEFPVEEELWFGVPDSFRCGCAVVNVGSCFNKDFVNRFPGVAASQEVAPEGGCHFGAVRRLGALFPVAEWR